MKFTKMQGCGNDYVYINCFEETVQDAPALARWVSDRHFGIGSDGLILIKPSETADFMMEMYNADGSQGEMCGNAIRCVGKYVYDHGMVAGKEPLEEGKEQGGGKRGCLAEREPFFEKEGELAEKQENFSGEKENLAETEGTPGKTEGTLAEKREYLEEKTEISVETLAGIKYLTLSAKAGKVYEVTVDMGIPAFAPEQIPVVAQGERVVDAPIVVGGQPYRMTAVSMGNPHAVVFVEDTRALPIRTLGPLFEHHERFPERVNTEFVQIIDRRNVNMRVWERGSDETWACGTGACASAVAAIVNGHTDEEVTVHMLGGDLRIRYDREGNGHVYMTGPAVEVFCGELCNGIEM